MASTNKTINYNLSQYVANDKPTYLADYNSDMNKIDTQMKANNDLAGLAKTEADDLSSRVDGQDVIIGTLNTTVGQHTNDISSLNTNVSEVNTKIGDLTDLNTTDKTDIVSAVNEVNTKVGDLTDLDTTNKSDIVSAVNEVKGDILNLNTYSTNETIIGKWINGEPIYRKVFVVNHTSGQQMDIDLTSLNISTIVNARGFAHRTSTNQLDLIPNGNVISPDYALWFSDFSLNAARIRFGTNVINDVDYVNFIIEYVKTSA